LEAGLENPGVEKTVCYTPAHSLPGESATPLPFGRKFLPLLKLVKILLKIEKIKNCFENSKG
jgi:hypothetical protein